MTRPAEHQLPQSIFNANEPVVQSHPLLENAVRPTFGQTDVWDFNGVVRRNANLPECQWKFRFHKGLDDPEWNLTAREIAMIMANPRHEAIIDARVHLPPKPFDLGTIIGTLSSLRNLARWAQADGLSGRMQTWRVTDLRRFITSLERRGLSLGTVKNHIMLIKRLHEIGPALSLGGPRTDPWRTTSARKAAKMGPPGELSTPVIPPEIWFPLTKAAWTYVHTFAPDVLRAFRRLDELRTVPARPRFGHGEMTHLVEEYLADPTNAIPLRARHATVPSCQATQQMVHWELLKMFIGLRPTNQAFSPTGLGNERRLRVLAALRAGHRTTTGLVDDLVQTTRLDGTTGPWHPGLDPFEINRMLPKLRDAAFCLVAALSMMRDSEKRAVASDAAFITPEHWQIRRSNGYV